MKKSFIFLLIFSLCLTSGPAFAQEDYDDYYDEDEEDLPEAGLVPQAGEAAAFGSADATAISMGIWGVVLVIGIGVAAGLLQHKHSGSSNH